MRSRNKIRLGAACAAIAVTAALAASLGPAANGLDHLLRHAFDSLSPERQALAKAIAGYLPFWLPGTVVALAAGVIAERQRRREQADEAGGPVGRR